MPDQFPFKTGEDRGEDAPLHPGEVLREDILPHLKLTPARFAAYLGVPESELAALLAERVPITLDLVMRLGAALETDPRYWLSLQMQHDLWHARHAPACDIKPIRMRSRPAQRDATQTAPPAV